MADDKGVQTKRSVVVHKKDEKVTNLYQLIAQQQEYLTELTRMYGELPSSKHKGVRGTMKPTLKQENVAKQIEKAEKRLDTLMKMLEKEHE